MRRAMLGKAPCPQRPRPAPMAPKSPPIDALCVFCGSSTGTDPAHADAARALGRILAEQGIRLVYGAGRNGLMGIMADACLAAGGTVTGVIPHHLVAWEVAHDGLDSLLQVDTMHERKQRMFDLSDAVAVLPGGIGTLDETIEMLSWRQLGLHDKPVVLVDSAGYWAPLLALLDRVIAAGFAREAVRGLYHVAADAEAVLPTIAAAGRARTPGRSDLF
jgi:uncharacterized protein (TIGR00730 family)